MKFERLFGRGAQAPQNKDRTDKNLNENLESVNELPFEEQLQLAVRLSEAVDDRNKFTSNFGGFDTFAEAGQHVDNNRTIFNNLELAVSEARADLDSKIQNKKMFVERLKKESHDGLAKRISQMFKVR